MYKYLILLILTSVSLYAQESDENIFGQDSVQPISPRYIFVKQKDGSYKTHQIYKYYEDGSWSPKIKEQRLFLYADGLCLIINNYKHYQLKDNIKSLEHPFDLHGYVVNSEDIKHVDKNNPAPRYSCPNETDHKKVSKKNGISKAYFDKWLYQENVSTKDFEELLKAGVYVDKVDPYHTACQEIKDLKKMSQYLIDNGYLKMSMNTRHKNYVIPIHAGAGAPYMWNINYELHPDHKIPYQRRDVEVALTDKAIKLINEGEKLEAEYRNKKNEKFIKLFEKAINEKIKEPPLKTITQKNSNYDLPPRYLLLLPFEKHTRKFIINTNVKIAKWVNRKIISRFMSTQFMLGEIANSIFNSATDPNEIEKILAENPANLLATMDEEEEKKACRRIFYNADAYVSLYSLLAEFETQIEDLQRYELLVTASKEAKINDEPRSFSKNQTNTGPIKQNRVNKN